MTRAMKHEQREAWSVTRQKGKRRFIILHGILRWGILWAILVTLTECLIKYGFNLPQWGNFLTREWFWILFRAILFGVLMGFALWRNNEKAFLEAEGD